MPDGSNDMFGDMFYGLGDALAGSFTSSPAYHNAQSTSSSSSAPNHVYALGEGLDLRGLEAFERTPQFQHFHPLLDGVAPGEEATARALDEELVDAATAQKLKSSGLLQELYNYRKQLLANSETYTEWANDPIGFNEVVLRGFFWSKQKEVSNALVHHRRVAVRSCHDVGKSALAARIATWWICAHPPEDVFVVTMAPTWRQVTAILWREINQLHAKFGLIGRITQKQWYINEQLVAFGTSPAGHDPTALQGIHARNVLVIMDEACGIEKPLWDAVDSLVANETSRLLAIGNPDDPSTQFHEVCRPGSGWHVVGIDAFESPNLTGEPIPDWLRPLLVSKMWVEEKRLTWGESSPQWASKVRGRFPVIGDDTLIGEDAIRLAVSKFSTTPPGSVIELGVDVARYGSNASIIVLNKMPRVSIYKKLRNRDTMYLVGEIVNAVRETKATVIKIDDAGLGGGPLDRLRELQKTEPHRLPPSVKILGINAGSAASKKKASERFFNLRAELYWNLRTLFNEGHIAIDGDQDMQKQLSHIKYSIDSHGRICVETKEELKKRGLQSPDEADALMLACAPSSLFAAPEWAVWDNTTKKQSIVIPIFRR
jgi:hypothetical protein